MALTSERYNSQVQGLWKLFGGLPRLVVCLCVAYMKISIYAYSKKKNFSDVLISGAGSVIFRRLSVTDNAFSFLNAAL